MIQIFSADNNWGIGLDNQLLFRAKGDMAFFRATTLGKVVVMGRKTLESLPGGRPLPGRTNIVLSRTMENRDGITICASLPELFKALAPHRDEDIYIMGGAKIYRLLLPYCGKAVVTRFDAQKEADSFVPNLDRLENWSLTHQSDPQTEKGLTYTWCTYVQQNPQTWRLEE